MQTGKETLVYCYAELKEELQELKQTMDSVVADLWKLKVQPAEPKPELDTKKCHIVLDCLVVSLVFWLCRCPDWCICCCYYVEVNS